jgi:hypothetical protein
MAADRSANGHQVLDLLELGIIGHSRYEGHVEAMYRRGDLVPSWAVDGVTDPPDETPVHRRFTNVWRAEGGSWKLIIRPATRSESRAATVVAPCRKLSRD